MTKVVWQSIYCRIPAGQHRQVAAIARKEHGGKTGRYIAHLIQTDLNRRQTASKKAKKGTTTP